ncbi:hypothetical protein BESB_015300 [Besnoitia besnoiti]|uniref:Uncharacterized protein n=1 Tax=Besnoitia besnoiti TaxID=94643 RepID=A0A2A9MBC0_BESBE|nr:hypothetical protein BESB_015300 [Besnoitia besnoiti]PFH32917.1 hypothetical protein BESB_015300 [Besnoitia besnoiti]
MATSDLSRVSLSSSTASVPSSSLFARSQAAPFVLQAYSSWWDPAPTSADCPREGDSQALTERKDDDEAGKHSAGSADCSAPTEIERRRRLARLRRDFDSASFWVVDSCGPAASRSSACSSSSLFPACTSRSSPEQSGDANAEETRGGRHHTGASKPAGADRGESESGVAETVQGSDGDVGGRDSGGEDVLPPLFRLLLKHSCNLTLVGKRLCASDLLLRPLAVVHAPASEQKRNADAQQAPEEGNLTGGRQKPRPDEGGRDLARWQQLLVAEQSTGKSAKGEEGPTEGFARSSVPALASPSEYGSSLYLRHITLNIPASSPLASPGAFTSGEREEAPSAAPREGAQREASEKETSLSVEAIQKAPGVPALGPVFSYGLLLVQLEALPEKVRAEVLRAATPFGRLLEDNGVCRRVCVEAKLHIHMSRSFFDVEPRGHVVEAEAKRQDANGGELVARSHETPRREGCICVFVPPANNAPGREDQTCTFGRWSLMLCNNRPAARVLEILNASLLLRAAVRARRLDKERETRAEPRTGADAGERGTPACSRNASRPHSKISLAEEEAVLAHLNQVCLCSAQDCPVHREWLEIPSVWGPPAGFSAADSRCAATAKQAGQHETTQADTTETCFNCNSALCVEMFRRD